VRSCACAMLFCFTSFFFHNFRLLVFYHSSHLLALSLYGSFLLLLLLLLLLCVGLTHAPYILVACGSLGLGLPTDAGAHSRPARNAYTRRERNDGLRGTVLHMLLLFVVSVGVF